RTGRRSWPCWRSSRSVHQVQRPPLQQGEGVPLDRRVVVALARQARDRGRQRLTPVDDAQELELRGREPEWLRSPQRRLERLLPAVARDGRHPIAEVVAVPPRQQLERA